jgi:CheY-like chemotaxis protein
LDDDAGASGGPALFTADPKLLQRVAPVIARVLVADPTVAGQRLLSELLRNLGAPNVLVAETTARALRLARDETPSMIFTELTGENLDGLQLAKLIRKSELACRKAPIIMVTAEATPRTIFGARDAGVHEFLRKPYAIADLLRRLDAVSAQPRDWIEGIAYIGPDRRRFNSGEYAGPRKRRADEVEQAERTRVLQAMKIVTAALAALESDPGQAHRALLAQAQDIQHAAIRGADVKLASAAADLSKYLGGAGPAGLARVAVASHVRTLWSLLPPEMEAEAKGDQAAA